MSVTTTLQIRFEQELDKTPTVKELIAELQKCQNQDAPVTVYLLDGDEEGNRCNYDPTGRYPIVGVDDCFDDHRRVELNIVGPINKE